MPIAPLRRLSAYLFTRLRRTLARVGDSIRSRPALSAWFYRADADAGSATPSADAAYRDFNLSYFARFGEQEKMLADRPRMDFYHAAIARRVQPGDRVIDLGTGTGILAAFAARRGAAQVYAIDHSEILEHARGIAAHNGIEHVEFVSTHSRDFTLPERVDVLLHEQMGDFLFDEAMVPNVLDLRDRLLKPGGLIVPSRFEFFCEPVKIRDVRRVPFIWELKVHGYDYSCLERDRPQDPGYYRGGAADPDLVEHALGEPAPALTFDLQTLREADLPREIRVARTVINAGRLDGFVIYFRTLVDDDLALGSGPLDRGRAPHWGFRLLRVEAETFAVGDIIDLSLSVEDWAAPDTWRWTHTRRAPEPAAAAR